MLLYIQRHCTQQSVCCAPQLYRIKEGIAALARALVQNAQLHKVHLRSTVGVVERAANGSYTLHVSQLGNSPGGSSTTPTGTDCVRVPPTATKRLLLLARKAPLRQLLCGPYDAVVLATPLELSDGLAFLGYFDDGDPAAGLPLHHYQTTVVSFVAGQLNPAYFMVRLAAAAVAAAAA